MLAAAPTRLGTGAACDDHHSECVAWARNGECSGAVALFMVEQCPRSCGVCRVCTGKQQSLEAALDQCGPTAGNGACASRETLERCPASCGACAPGCADLSPDCHLWVPERCESDPAFMARNCPLACSVQPESCAPACQTRIPGSGCPRFDAPRHLLSPPHADAIRRALKIDGPTVAAFNPTVLSDKLVFYNVNSWAVGLRKRNASAFSAFVEQAHVVGVAGSRVRYRVPRAEDLRLIHAGPRLLGTFSRYRKPQRKDVWLAQLEPTYKERRVVLAKGIAPARRVSEGNWMPFWFRGQLLASYFLCPHTVLRINEQTGNATRVYETKHPSCDKFSPSGNPLRGGTAGVYVPQGDYVVGVGHYKRFGAYTHALVQRSAVPPFEVRNFSLKFRFPGMRLPTAAQKKANKSIFSHIQFSLSMRRLPNRAFEFHYGVSDRSSHAVTLSWAAYCEFTQWCGCRTRRRDAG